MIRVALGGYVRKKIRLITLPGDSWPRVIVEGSPVLYCYFLAINTTKIAWPLSVYWKRFKSIESGIVEIILSLVLALANKQYTIFNCVFDHRFDGDDYLKLKWFSSKLYHRIQGRIQDFPGEGAVPTPRDWEAGVQNFYRLQMKLREGNVFTPVCQSFCSQGLSGGGVYTPWTPPPHYGQQTGGTHPTGMFSCSM